MSKLNMWKFGSQKSLRQLPYAAISEDVDVEDDAFNSSTSTLNILADSAAAKKKKERQSLIFFCFSSLVLFLSFSLYLYHDRQRVSDEKCFRRMSAPSPVLDAVEYEWTVFSDDFRPDVYSGYPNNDSEAAWGKLWDFGAFSVPLNSLAGLNKSSVDGDFRIVETDAGKGVGGLLEGAHQIHCLNLVRQFIYRDHWDYSKLPSFSGGEKVKRHHVDHCVATLRTVLTCLSDVTPYVPVESHGAGGVESRGLPHKCRKYDRMVSWVHEHSVFSNIE